ncbi:MAG: DUF4012 domain-containing protein [Microlunatus sp.]
MLVALAAVLVGAGLTAYVGQRAWAAKTSMEQAQDQLRVFKSALGEADRNLPELYAPLQASAEDAARKTSGPVWSLYEHIWWIGPNLKAFRQTTELVDALVRDGIEPLASGANGVNVDNLKPKNGQLDIEPIERLVPASVKVNAAIQAANTAAAEIDTARVVPQLRAPITKLQDQLRELAPVSQELGAALPLLPGILGAEGTRHYLLIFQNNAEERASGGNPASMAMLVVKNGKIALGGQASSADFPHPYQKAPYTPTGPGNEDWDSIYTEHASTYLTNITMTPDFPTTARMAKAMWQDRFGGEVDGVISFDPIALSYLLRATGPITLSDGTVLDQGNTVPVLLHDVYANYPDSQDQDEVFASAAQRIFAAVTSGQGDPRTYLAQLNRAVAEQRLKVWSARAEEQAMLKSTPVATMLPADNESATVVGVYNNDDATSKMSYFMDERIAVAANTCVATPTYTVTATVTNTLRKNQIDGLPEYVRAHQKNIPAGGDRQWVQLYGPVGGTLKSVTIDGKPVVWGTSANYRKNTVAKATGADIRRPAVQGTMYGRPVGMVSITIPAASSVTVEAVFTGGPEDSETVQVSHTPKVRDVPVELSSATCR